MVRRNVAAAAALVCSVTAPMSTPTYAAKKWECAGWICAPVGFAVPYCGEPLKAMMKRVLKFKSPLPTFSSCTSNGRNDDGFSFTTTKLSVYYPVLGSMYPPGGSVPFKIQKGWEDSSYEARLNAPKLFLKDAECEMGKLLPDLVRDTIANEQGHSELVNAGAEWVCVNKLKGTTIWNDGVPSEKTTFVSTSRLVIPADPFNYVWVTGSTEISIAVDHLEIPYEGVTEAFIAAVEDEEAAEAEAQAETTGDESGEVQENPDGDRYEAEGENPVVLDADALAAVLANDPENFSQLSDALPNYTSEQLSTYGSVESLQKMLSGYTGYISEEVLPDDFSREIPDYSGAEAYSAYDWDQESRAMLLDNNASDVYTRIPGAAGEMTSEVPFFQVDDAATYLNDGLKNE